MRPELYVVIDDRERPPPELEGLIGYIHFGDLLRRRQRYVDELTAAAAGADDVIVLRSSEDADRLVRRIEAVRGDTLWLRLPVISAPLDMGQLDQLIRKMRYALEPILLAPVQEDDAPMVLFPRDAIDLITAQPGKDRRSHILRLADEATQVDHNVDFVDLRQPDALRVFLSGATEPRKFNNLSAEAGVFVKSSQDIAKMKAEHDYFDLAPAHMQRFLLPTFDYVESDDVASYSMEHLRVPDAALQFVLGTFSETHFGQLLDQFFAFINARDPEVIGREAVRDKGREQILTKMQTRLKTFLDTAEGAHVDQMLTSGGVTGGLADLESRAAPLIEAALADHTGDHLAFSHGDPCLSNILFDHRIGLIRLIDPRGATVREDALLHPLYDVAKFSHTVCGGYDFVNNTLFSIEVDADLKLELQRHRGGAPDWVKDVFKTRLAAEGWDYRQVRAVEASLFLSMLPLHLDHPRKLLSFALIAKEIIEELEGSA